MTKKDFELIASVLYAVVKEKNAHTNEHSDHENRLVADALNSVLYDFADKLETTNERFDRQRFLRASGCHFEILVKN